MKYQRKTRHDYNKFMREIGEGYLNRRFQLGYHTAGRWLKKHHCLSDYTSLSYNLALAEFTLRLVYPNILKGLNYNKKK